MEHAATSPIHSPHTLRTLHTIGQAGSTLLPPSCWRVGAQRAACGSTMTPAANTQRCIHNPPHSQHTLTRHPSATFHHICCLICCFRGDEHGLSAAAPLRSPDWADQPTCSVQRWNALQFSQRTPHTPTALCASPASRGVRSFVARCWCGEHCQRGGSADDRGPRSFCPPSPWILICMCLSGWVHFTPRAQINDSLHSLCSAASL